MVDSNILRELQFCNKCKHLNDKFLFPFNCNINSHLQDPIFVTCMPSWVIQMIMLTGDE